MADELKWDSRLEVKVGADTITPIANFNPTFNVPVQPVHSLEADNVAHLVQPQTFTFTMTVQAIGSSVAKLTDMARRRQSFTVGVSEKKGTDWTFTQIGFNNCYITSVANTIVIDGVPSTTFNCICLEVISQGR